MNGQSDKVGPGPAHEPPQELSSGRLARLAWLPIPLLVAAIIVARAAGSSESYMSEPLRLALSLTFYTLVSLGTLFLIGRTFLSSGKPGLLLLECGVVLWSLAGTVGDAVAPGDANVNATIFNTVIFLAGACHLAGAVLSLRPREALRAPPLWLGGACALALGALWLVTHAALAGWLPVFFIPGRGGTLVRYCVLVSAIAMFVLSAILLLAGKRAARAPFTSWYALAMFSLSAGLFGIMIQLSFGSVVNWLARTAQWLGGLYLLFAAVAALRESHLPLLPQEKELPQERYRYGVGIAIVLAATAVRFALSPALGTAAPLLTFYPAVMLAALYGGLRAGLLTTVLSALIVDCFWIEPVGQFTIGSLPDWITLLFFLLACTMICFIVEATHRAGARASAAEMQALLAAEREATAEVLRKSEARYHTLFTGMTEGFAIHELLTDESGKPVDYRFLDVNPAFESLTGLKRQDVVGRTHNEVLPGNDPKWLRTYSRVALTGQPVQFENYAPVLKRHYEVFAYRPAPMQFAVIFMDVTERKQTEEKMRQTRAAAINLMEDAVEARRQTEQANEKLRQEITERKRAEDALQKAHDELELRVEERTEALRRQADLLELAYEAILVRDLESRITFWNAAAQELYGWTRLEALGSLTHTLLKTRFPVSFDEHMAALTEEGRWEGELEHTTKDGRTITVLSRQALQRDKAGNPAAILEINLDVTEARRTEHQLRQAQKMEALGTLTGGIAHDFNNILAAIIGFTELVEGHVPKQSREAHHLNRVMESSLRGRDLVRQMLTFARKTEQERKPMSLSSLVKETVKLVRATTPTTINIRVDTRGESGLILADPTQMQQVIMNLCTNAAFAMREKGGTLHIRLDNHSPSPSNDDPHGINPGLYTKLTVRDTGAGMPPDIMDKIFDPFFTTKKLGEGTGLGLSVVHGIVKQSNGHITVESTPGEGSVFNVYFPQITGTGQLEADAVGDDMLPTGSERILLIDDEEALVEMGEDVLAELGYDVTSRMSSREALALVRADPSRFDLVITDQTMPEMTGVELAKEILALKPDMPIIMCTGFSYLVDADKARAAGIKAFAMKPLTKREIARTIRKVLDG